MFFKKNKNSSKIENINETKKNVIQKKDNTEKTTTFLLNKNELKGNHVFVPEDFSVNQLKPFQKLVIIKDDGKIKKAVFDYSISINDLNRIKNTENEKVKAFEIISNRPFRLISQYDIDNAQGLNYSIKGTFNNYLINESSSIDIARSINFNDVIIPLKDGEEKIDEKKVSNAIENFDWDQFNFNPISNKKYLNNKDKLIYDNSSPIVLHVNKSEEIIYPFKIRELNQNWNDLDYSDLYKINTNAKFNLMDEYFSTINLNKELQQKNPIFSRNSNLFFKVIYDTYNEKKIIKEEKAVKFYKNKYNSNYEKFKFKKNNNLTIVRRKIDKKLLKEKEVKGYL